MKELRHINKFMFDYAQYQLQDADGNEMSLKVDYKNGGFKIEPQSAAVSSVVVKEIETFAQDLLSRKSGVNFAEEK